jgi:hypothetical protein
MKKSNSIYYIGGAILLYIIYKKYYKTPTQTPIIKNALESNSQSTTPAQQVAAPTESLVANVISPVEQQFNPPVDYTGRQLIDVKYAISGSRTLKGTPSII